MWPIATNGVAWSVGLSAMIVSPAKVTEPILIPFWILTQMGPRNHVLDEVQISHVKVQF